MKAGRKKISESRAAQIRERLLVWQQLPEADRPSLRTLAGKLGTSHQLLGFYLKGLSEWQRREYQARVKAIRDRAAAEDRSLTYWEEQDARRLENAAFFLGIDSIIETHLKRFETNAKSGTLSGLEFKVLRTLAQRGVPNAQKILRVAEQSRPRKQSSVDVALAKLGQTRDSDEACRIVEQLSPRERKQLLRARG